MLLSFQLLQRAIVEPSVRIWALLPLFEGLWPIKTNQTLSWYIRKTYNSVDIQIAGVIAHPTVQLFCFFCLLDPKVEENRPPLNIKKYCCLFSWSFWSGAPFCHKLPLKIYGCLLFPLFVWIHHFFTKSNPLTIYDKPVIYDFLLASEGGKLYKSICDSLTHAHNMADLSDISDIWQKD